MVGIVGIYAPVFFDQCLSLQISGLPPTERAGSRAEARPANRCTQIAESCFLKWQIFRRDWVIATVRRIKCRLAAAEQTAIEILCLCVLI